MELEKMREMSLDELRGERVKVAEQLFRIRFAKGLGRQEGLGRIKGLKKTVAQINTIGRERELAEQKVGS